MKTCGNPGCHYPVFSKGLCKLHWGFKHAKPIPKQTDKRKAQVDEYQSKRRQFIDRRRAEGKGKLWCPFCSNRIYGDPDIHHTMGRDDESLLDERYWHIGHFKCHSPMWHSLPVDKLPWFDSYLKWLKDNMPPDSYLKALKKKEKS